MDFGKKKVWAPDAIDGFVLGRIVDIGADAVTVDVEKPRKNNRVRKSQLREARSKHTRYLKK